MADTAVAITQGSGTNIDTRTEGTNGNHRQVVVLGDPATNAGVAPVDATAGLKVDLGADNDVTVTNATAANLKVDGSDVTQPVSGTVTANLSATDNAVLDNIDTQTAAIQTAVEIIDNAISGTEMQVDVVTSALPSGASTAANQSTIIGHVDGIEALLTTIDADTGNIDTSLNNIEAGYAAEAASLGSGVLIQGDDGTDRKNINVDATTGDVQVDVTNTVTVSNADMTTVAGAVSGTEMQVDIVASLPAGTNAIGKLAANSGVDIGDVTLTAGTAAVGTLLPPDIDVTSHTNYIRKYYTSATPTDGIIWSPAAGKRWHVLTLYLNVSAASTVTLEDDKSGGDDPVWKGELAANSGVVLTFPEKYPMASGEDAADLTVTATAGTVYITVVGYEV